jgi:hypothetical protein
VSFIDLKNIDPTYRRAIKKSEKNLKKLKVILEDEHISGVYEENGVANDVLQVLQNLHVES